MLLEVGVFTDPLVAKLKPMTVVSVVLLTHLCSNNPSQALESLQSQQDLPFEVFDQVVTEPTEESWRSAIDWARRHDFTHFLA